MAVAEQGRQAVQAEATDSRGAPQQGGAGAAPRRGRGVMLAILAVCAAPVIASYLAYYVFPPEGRVQYGALVEPQVGMADFALDAGGPGAGPDASFAALRGRWALVTVAPGACPGDCPQRLYAMRQVRLAVGKDAERVERVWLLSDGQAPQPELLAQHPGLLVWPAPEARIRERFAGAAEGGLERVYLIDPNGQLMMRFPLGADPGRIRKDLARLLKISRIG